MNPNNTDGLVPSIEVLVEQAEPPKEKKERRGGHRPGAGRPSLVRLNKERMAQGLEPIEAPKPKRKIAKKKSTAILPENKKKRHQEILAEMLGRKSQYIVNRILEKAMDDTDKDQMECMKIVIDRVLPKDYFAKASGKSNGITIQILGVDNTIISETQTEDNPEVYEADYEEIENE